MVTTRPPKTIVKPTALGPVANTDTKPLIDGLFQKGRVLAQDGIESVNALIEECAKVDHWKISNQRQRWLATPSWLRGADPLPLSARLLSWRQTLVFGFDGDLPGFRNLSAPTAPLLILAGLLGFLSGLL